MSVKLRLQRHGRKKRPFYHIVAADARAARNGRYIERVGWYNPVENPATIDIDRDLAIKWLNNGAQPTPTVRHILSNTGVLYRKHLLRGVEKGAFSQEEADRMFDKWLIDRAKKTNKPFTMIDWRIRSESAAALADAIALAKEKAEAAAPKVEETVAEKVEEVVENIKEAVEEVKEAVEEIVEEVKEAVEGVAEEEAADETNKDAE